MMPEPSAPPLKPPYCPPASDSRTDPGLSLTPGAFRRKAAYLASFGAGCLRYDGRQQHYLSKDFEDEIFRALQEAHASGMMEATQAFTKAQIEGEA